MLPGVDRWAGGKEEGHREARCRRRLIDLRPHHRTRADEWRTCQPRDQSACGTAEASRPTPPPLPTPRPLLTLSFSLSLPLADRPGVPHAKKRGERQGSTPLGHVRAASRTRARPAAATVGPSSWTKAARLGRGALPGRTGAPGPRQAAKTRRGAILARIAAKQAGCCPARVGTKKRLRTTTEEWLENGTGWREIVAI